MSKRFTPPLWLIVLLTVSALSSLYVLVQRFRTENVSRAAHLAVPLEDIRLVAAASGIPTTEAFARLKKSGMTAVIVSEDTFESLLLGGRIVHEPGQNLAYRCRDDALFARITNVFKERFGEFEKPTAWLISPRGARVGIPLALNDLKTFGAGFDAKTCQAVIDADLSLIVRVLNPPASQHKAIESIVKEINDVGAEGVIFLLDQVLGWRREAETTAKLLDEHGVWYGSVEFANQSGDSVYLRTAPQNVMRVHSVLPAEITQTDERTLVDRYVRAVRERNIRVCLIRPTSASSPDAVNAFGEFISSVKSSLYSHGSGAKKPTLISAPEIHWVFRAFIVIGIAGFSVWFLGVLFPNTLLHKVSSVLLILLAIAVLIYLPKGGLITGWKIFALIAALMFPTWAILSVFWKIPEISFNSWLPFFLLICGLSVLGGIHIAGLLTTQGFMVKADVFQGVKLAHIIQPLFVGSFLLFHMNSLRRTAEQNVKWVDMMILLVALVAFVLLVVRTGNEAPSAVSGWELQLRDLLDRFLPERPRTKEFLLGHPALVIGLMLWLKKELRYVPLFALLATIGQASIVNSFCHLHTPIAVTVVRVFMGMFVGVIIGVVAWAVWSSLSKGKLLSQEQNF